MPSTAKYQREWRAKNPGYAKRKSREYYDRHPEAIRKYNLRKYGLTVEQYDQLYAHQGGRCAACRRVDDLCVDHNHETGEVRALLCHGCNTALGMLKDDPLRIRALAAYAEQFDWLNT